MNNVNTAKLLKITNEAIGSKLDGEQFKTKKRAVGEFFKVVELYERYLNGEIGMWFKTLSWM